jgi:hypothetical protein
MAVTDSEMNSLIGRCTHEQTIDLTIQCLENLTLTDVINTLIQKYHRDDLEEIVAQLESIIE